MRFCSIIKFAETVKKEYKKIDILMNNAGLFPQNLIITKGQIESNLEGNFTGHVLLTFLLFDMFDKTDARIINLSSLAYLKTDFINDINIKELYDTEKAKEKYYGGFAGKWALYGNTKILMIYFSKYLSQKYDEKYRYIKSAALHPWGVDTEFSRFSKNSIFLTFLSIILFPLLKTPKDGAQTQLNLCYLPFNEFVSGGYYSDFKVTKTKEFANDYNKIKSCMDLTIQEIKNKINSKKININGKEIEVKQFLEI